jgi:hypothetical protein
MTVPDGTGHMSKHLYDDKAITKFTHSMYGNKMGDKVAELLSEDDGFAEHLRRSLNDEMRREPCECGKPTAVCQFSCDFCTGGPT